MRAAILLSIVALWVAGCAKKPKPERVWDGWAKGEEIASPEPARQSPARQGHQVSQRNPANLHLPPIYFRYNSADLQESETPKLQDIAPVLSGTCTASGYASPEGTDDYNLALSAHRAAAVTAYLHNINPKASLSPIGYGEENLVSAGDSTQWWRDRRVEVTCK